MEFPTLFIVFPARLPLRNQNATLRDWVYSVNRRCCGFGWIQNHGCRDQGVGMVLCLYSLPIYSFRLKMMTVVQFYLI